MRSRLSRGLILASIAPPGTSQLSCGGNVYSDVLLFLLSLVLPAADHPGRYQQRDGNVVVVESRNGALLAKPLFWSVWQTLVPDGPDRFHSLERPERIFTFARDGAGRITALSMTNMSHDEPLPRLTGNASTPAELLRAGRSRDAAKLLVKQRKDAAAIAAAWGEHYARMLPTKAAIAADFLSAVAPSFPLDAALQISLGDLLVSAGRRPDAIRSYERALELDPASERATSALRMLRGSYESLPLAVDALFSPPSAEEIAAVRDAWKRRDLRARDVQIVKRGTLGDYEVRIVTHRIYGSKHFGAILVPTNANAGCCPVVVEAKGVSPSYFPLDLARAYAPEILRGEPVIVFLPSYRGEVLLFDGERYQSEGDRTDVWDGATDDLIAFTTAALKVTPEAKPGRMCVFGKSRGGTVALLSGIRDERYDCVVEWSGPTDHFFEMVQMGFTPRERVAEGLYRKSDVFGMAGQFLETWLRAPLAGEKTLAETRLHILASSPLWFAESLPPTQLHYGEEDGVVSAGNGRALLRRLPSGRAEAHFYEDAGHDLEKERAYRETKRYLLQHLQGPPSSAEAPALPGPARP